MRKCLFIGLVAAGAALSSGAQAGSLDFRHEFKHDSKQHRNRVKFKDSAGIFYYGLELKLASRKNADGSQDLFGDFERGDSEVDIGIKYDLNDRWYIQPGMPIKFGDGSYSFKPQFRVGYRADSIPLTTTLRYRRQITRYSDDTKSSRAKNKVTFAMTYNPKPNEYWAEANYIKAADHNIFDNSKSDYDFQVGMGRQFGDWFPYFDLSNVSVSSKLSSRQLRTRIGIKYSF